MLTPPTLSVTDRIASIAAWLVENGALSARVDLGREHGMATIWSDGRVDYDIAPAVMAAERARLQRAGVGHLIA